MNDAELRSLERLCSKDDLSDSNVATLTVLGLKCAQEVRALRHLVESIDYVFTLIDEMRKADKP